MNPLGLALLILGLVLWLALGHLIAGVIVAAIGLALLLAPQTGL